MVATRNPVLAEDLAMIAQAQMPWQLLEGKRILISGASGFIASYLVETILYLNETRFERKATVYALVRDERRARERFAHHAGREDLVILAQDVSVGVPAVAPLDFIIHAASSASPSAFTKDLVGTMDANLLGTRNLLALASQTTAVFLLISTSNVYGAASSDTPLREDQYGPVDPLQPLAAYNESKRAAETMCMAWHRQHGLRTRIIRPFQIYGPGMRLSNGLAASDFLAAVLQGKDVVMSSDGSAIRSFCYVADLATACFTVLLKGEDAQAYNVGAREGIMTIRELAQRIAATRPELHLRVEVGPPQSVGQFNRLVPDITKLESLGWAARMGPHEGLQRTMRSYQQ